MTGADGISTAQLLAAQNGSGSGDTHGLQGLDSAAMWRERAEGVSAATHEFIRGHYLALGHRAKVVPFCCCSLTRTAMQAWAGLIAPWRWHGFCRPLVRESIGMAAAEYGRAGPGAALPALYESSAPPMGGPQSLSPSRSPCCCAGLLCGPSLDAAIVDPTAEGASGGCSLGCGGCSSCLGCCTYTACSPMCLTVDAFAIMTRVLSACVLLALGPAVDVGLGALSVVLCFGALAAWEGAEAVLAADGAARSEEKAGEAGNGDGDGGGGGGGSSSS